MGGHGLSAQLHRRHPPLRQAERHVWPPRDVSGGHPHLPGGLAAGRARPGHDPAGRVSWAPGGRRRRAHRAHLRRDRRGGLAPSAGSLHRSAGRGLGVRKRHRAAHGRLHRGYGKLALGVPGERPGGAGRPRGRLHGAASPGPATLAPHRRRGGHAPGGRRHVRPAGARLGRHRVPLGLGDHPRPGRGRHAAAGGVRGLGATSPGADPARATLPHGDLLRELRARLPHRCPRCSAA